VNSIPPAQSSESGDAPSHGRICRIARSAILFSAKRIPDLSSRYGHVLISIAQRTGHNFLLAQYVQIGSAGSDLQL
jgi:hypothetical protein